MYLTAVNPKMSLLFGLSAQDDEYVVYSPDQVKLKYVVQFSIEGDKLKEFSPDIITADEPRLPSSIQGEPRTLENILKV